REVSDRVRTRAAPNRDRQAGHADRHVKRPGRQRPTTGPTLWRRPPRRRSVVEGVFRLADVQGRGQVADDGVQERGDVAAGGCIAQDGRYIADMGEVADAVV